MALSDESRAYAAGFDIPIVTSDSRVIMDNPEIETVMICSPTSSHADYVKQAADARKNIFCEKPLDLSIEKVKQTLNAVRKANVPLMLAFNQRFDENFSKVREYVRAGKLGSVHSLHIISRDPAPPPVSYIRTSGGLFMDMMIHDFDMARFVTGSEVVEVFAKGYNLIDPEIGEAGDIDTGIALLTFENNATAIIENSRKAVYGYDQRLEVFGSKGLMRAENPLKDTCTFSDQTGDHQARHLDFFMDRYMRSYLTEVEAFLKALRDKTPTPVTGEDGLKAMLIAEAAKTSLKENRPVKL